MTASTPAARTRRPSRRMHTSRRASHPGGGPLRDVMKCHVRSCARPAQSEAAGGRGPAGCAAGQRGRKPLPAGDAGTPGLRRRGAGGSRSVRGAAAPAVPGIPAATLLDPCLVPNVHALFLPGLPPRPSAVFARPGHARTGREQCGSDASLTPIPFSSFSHKLRLWHLHLPSPPGTAGRPGASLFRAYRLRPRARARAGVGAGAVRAPDCARETQRAPRPSVPAGFFLRPRPCVCAEKGKGRLRRPPFPLPLF